MSELKVIPLHPRGGDAPGAGVAEATDEINASEMRREHEDRLHRQE